jgi:hypothetical protein
MAITSEGTYQDFSCTKSIQTFTAPFSGLYKFEVWGAQGGHSTYGGKGGYSLGYKVLTKGDVLYVGVGGKGAVGEGSLAGGYNGGGSAYPYSGESGSGGGCTHIATVTGTLSSIGASNKSKVLIVAGGGGGYRNAADQGGYGGGTTGGTGAREESKYTSGTGGTQTAAGGGNATGSFGQGGNGNTTYTSGGGGGLYGGGAGWAAGAGGGSGYIGGVPTITFKGTTYSPSTTGNKRSGNGKSRITFVKKRMTVYLGDTLLSDVYLGDIALTDTIIPS